MSRFLFLMAALVALTGAAAAPAARAEKSAPIDEIPLCPGAVPAPNDDSISVPLLGFTLDQERRYLVKAAPEAVVRFYQKKLSAREVLGNWYSHVAIDCHDDGGDLTESVALPLGDAYFLVVPLSGGDEGSYGFDSSSRERPPAAAACRPSQALGCP